MSTGTPFLFRSVHLWLCEKANLCAKATNISLTKVSNNYETSISFCEGHILDPLRTLPHAETIVIITLVAEPCPHKQFRTFSVFL